MESVNIWSKDGLIIRHRGRLTTPGMLANIRNIQDSPSLDRLKYVVTDYSDVSGVDLDEGESEEIGALLHDLLVFHGLLSRNIRWAVTTSDRRIETFVHILAWSIGESFRLR